MDAEKPRPYQLSARVERLQESAKRAALYLLPVFFVGITILLLIVNWRPEYTLSGHVLESLFRGAGGAICCSAAVYGGLWLMTGMVQRSTSGLTQSGQLVKVHVAKPTIVGGHFMNHVVGGALGRIWEPLAPTLSTKLPVFSVGYSFDIDGKKVHTSEIFYGNEQVTRDEKGEAWALVDPSSPHTRRWLIKEKGQLQDCPF